MMCTMDGRGRGQSVLRNIAQQVVHLPNLEDPACLRISSAQHGDTMHRTPPFNSVALIDQRKPDWYHPNIRR